MSVTNKKVVFTGTLQGLTRMEASHHVMRNGGTVGTSVTGNTNIVVAGPGAGSKLTKAQQLENVEIWNEAQFMDAVGNPNSINSESHLAGRRGVIPKGLEVVSVSNTDFGQEILVKNTNEGKRRGGIASRKKKKRKK